MGLAVRDVVTSAPSVWGAANAASATIVLPMAAPVAILLASVVSDPAQMWHAGDRYAVIAGHIRTASGQMTEAVNHRASADHWQEKARDAFVATRVRPYQQTLEQAAAMYEHIETVLKRCAVAYTAVGLSSAVIGAALNRYVAPLLAAAVVPSIKATATYVANAAMVEANAFVRALIAGLAKVNGAVLSVLVAVAAKLEVSDGLLLGLGTTGLTLGGGA